MTTDVFAQLAAVNPWINGRLVFIVRHGSHAYGTNIEGSDEDFRGAAVAPKECYLGFKNKFEQLELKDPDTTIFELQKFFSLASGANPNVLETLFVDPSDHIFVSPAGELLLEHRDKFISKRARFSFAGYARGQLHRIKLHRGYLLNPPTHKPTREEFGLLPEPSIPTGQLLAVKAAIKKELDRFTLGFLDDFREDQKVAIQNAMQDILVELEITRDDQWLSAARKIGLTDNFIEYMKMERSYDNKKREWDNYNTWKKNRNPKRAEMEAKYGMDCKHAGHLVRLTRRCRELFETGKLNVKCLDAEELIAIRNGAWTYEQLIDYTETEHAKLDEICAKSKIANEPDDKFLDELCIKMIGSMI